MQITQKVYAIWEITFLLIIIRMMIISFTIYELFCDTSMRQKLAPGSPDNSTNVVYSFMNGDITMLPRLITLITSQRIND